MTSCPEALRIWGFWEKSESWDRDLSEARRLCALWAPCIGWVSWVPASEEDGWLSDFAEALWWVPHVVWGGWKHCHRKIVPLSSLCRKTFNSKVIKRFVPELRSHKCFFVFQDSYVIYMCIMDIMNVLRTGMNMSISRNHVWLRNIMTDV